MTKFNIDTSCTRAMARAVFKIPADRREMFGREWNDLTSAGAELVDLRHVDGGVVCSPSDDFMRHCDKYGVTVDV